MEGNIYKRPLQRSCLLVGLAIGITLGAIACRDGVRYE